VSPEESKDEPEVSSINSWLHMRLGVSTSDNIAFPTLPQSGTPCSLPRVCVCVCECVCVCVCVR
jgi:hypothetical protein